MLKRIVSELKEHIPFTLLGAVVGVIFMVIIDVTNASSSISKAFFYSLHPLHIVFSALVTTAMFRIYRKNQLWMAISSAIVVLLVLPPSATPSFPI